jgi:hypothetical protein
LGQQLFGFFAFFLWEKERSASLVNHKLKLGKFGDLVDFDAF